ncbi:DNA cytosine methyltransferase [Leptospira levettii]|nr:DNA cytosine methyltransferase [Leptospira levettii]MCW7520832.1 DNA cytosine methyltransferase [Leptospira levettii]
MGFEEAGFEVVWSNEHDDDFAKIHANGITSWRKSRGENRRAEIFNKNSIVEVSDKQIIKEAFANDIPKIFGIIGGPPCQDFTINGGVKGFEGERGKLTIIFLDKIKSLKPSFFVMENVPGLIRKESNRNFLESLLDSLKVDYEIDYQILNSINFGVPQSRERVFFIGINKKLKCSVDFSQGKFQWPRNEKYESALSKFSWPSVNKFGSGIRKPRNLPIELCVASCLVKQVDRKKIPNANEFFRFVKNGKRLEKIKEGETNRPSFRRLHRYRYSPTTCYGNNEVHLHPYENRRISVREALRIQGVSDNYIMPEEVTLSKKFKVISNGVPVPMARELAQKVKEFINLSKSKKNTDIESKTI